LACRVTVVIGGGRGENEQIGRTARRTLLVLGIAAICAAAVAGGFLIGHSGSANLAAARKAGRIAGKRVGAHHGLISGQHAGYGAGFSAAYRRAYSRTYRVAYRKASGQ